MNIPALSQLLVAFTAHGAGEEFNLERLEFLGDSFLKFAASNKVFEETLGGEEAWKNIHVVDEGTLTIERMKIISNKRLCLR